MRVRWGFSRTAARVSHLCRGKGGCRRLPLRLEGPPQARRAAHGPSSSTSKAASRVSCLICSSFPAISASFATISASFAAISALSAAISLSFCSRSLSLKVI